MAAGEVRVDARAVAARLPAAPGVYRFRDERDRILYIGRATSLRHRVGSYWGKLTDRRHLARMIARIERVEAVACDSVHEAAWLERNLLQRRKPYWNRARGGAEVPVYIRLDRGAGSAVLRLVHEHELDTPSHHFGPYLGGAKVRLAMSALHRVVPVAYTSDSLSGSQRDMARVRGIGPGDREELVGTAIAVLARDATTVQSVLAELARRRDAAAVELAFELAGRMHEEMEALAWISAEQKAAVLTPVDLDIAGWADGMLVRFEVRAGRLGGWTQRACTETLARPAVDATPSHWRAFAQRNAELAVRLREGL